MHGLRGVLIVSGFALAACGDSGERGDTFGENTSLTTADDESNDEVEGEGDGDGDGDSTTGTKFDMGETEGESSTTGNECAAVSEMAMNEYAPVDIIFAIDTSGSMSDEKNFVQQNMNAFSIQISLAMIDSHVVMIAANSPDGPCIASPLGSGQCPNDSSPPEYVHVVNEVGSTDALAKILETQPQWVNSIRPNSVKHLVVVSDDESSMSSTDFDAAFKAFGPEYEDYVFHAIVAFDAPSEGDCLLGADCCFSFIPLAEEIGQQYLNLVSQTGGVAGDLCDQQFGPVFTAISQSVQQNTPLACEWDIPEPPEGESFDPTKVNVELLLDGIEEDVFYVENEAACNGGDGWYYWPDALAPETIRICPATCTRVQDATQATVDILFGCDTIPIG